VLATPHARLIGQLSSFENKRRQLRQRDHQGFEDDDGSRDSSLPLHLRYFYAFYWALCTLVGSGSSDVIPITDAERMYDLCVALLSALVFGYIIGEINRLFASLDRQSALVEERMDAIKEYLAWRQVPRKLAVKVKRYYEHYYAKASAFDEEEILKPMPPTMHNEVVCVAGSRFLGLLPCSCCPRQRYR